MSEQQRLKYAELSPAGLTVMRQVEHYLNVESGLETVLLELVRLRASLMNGCEFCIALHTRELRKHNEPESRIAAVGTWRGTDAFTERERAALAWTESVTNVQDGHITDSAFQAVREHFEDKELVELTIAISSINAWNRMAIAFRAQWDAGRVTIAAGVKKAEGTGAESAAARAGEHKLEGNDA